MASYTLRERMEQIKDLLVAADGSGITTSDIARRLFLSKHRVRQILQVMKNRKMVVETRVEGSYHHFGLMLYFDPNHFVEMTGIDLEPSHTYRLFQRCIFEIIPDMPTITQLAEAGYDMDDMP